MTQFIGIRSEGGLIPYDILDKIAREEDGFGQQAKNFGLPAGRRLTDEISRAWSDAQDYWHIFQRRSANLPEDETGTTLTRKWVSDLLNELLGYELVYQPTGAVVGGRNYPISHRAGEGEQSPPVHIEGFRIDIDRRLQGRRMSSQALVQEYLNNSDGHLWGIVTNGMLFRLLRDTSRTSRPTYLEFDLQSILDGNRFNEFALFYRVCHRSRLPKTAEDSTSCWLEKYFQISIEQGGRVRDKLRDGVEDALKCLGTGFLRHPKNEHLLERVKSGNLTATEFHRQLLRLVYRLLFLMVAEERRMIVPEAPDSERRQRLYDNYYSVGRLRNLAEESIEPTTFGDLWICLQQTFRLFEDAVDSNPLGVPPLNGDLFSNIAVRDIQDTHLFNTDLLYAIHRLSLFDERRVLQRVNYRDLDVEELGSVYESLLDYQPVFVPEAEGTRFDLRTGSERKSTGSYYTRPELVRELIESALVPVMQDRLETAKDKDAKQKAILSMSVCDPACGSGHFLLAASRRLGRELARVRSGEDEPTPKEFHLAVRDVIAHCIYGVDLNPLAVDLCKLALWLEGHWTGKPLSFLDHRIKLGNSLVGVLDMKVLEEGIPDEAFTAVTGDDKKVASAFKKRNKDERKGQPSLPFDTVDHVHHFASASADLVSIEEDTPADVRRKKEAYEKSRQKPEWWHDWVAANLWTTAFFCPLTKFDDPVVPTHEAFMTFFRGKQVAPRLEGAAISIATELSFFHWQMEFPVVFEVGGFDVVLGNPPWERLKLQEEEHWVDDPYICNAPNKAARAKRIDEYRQSDDRSKHERIMRFDAAKRSVEGTSKFIREGDRFALTAVGDFNTYALFSELARKLLAERGRAGLVVPTGIATDDNCKQFFASLVQNRNLVSLFDFENRGYLFPTLHTKTKFSLITLANSSVQSMSFCFMARATDELRDERKRFVLTREDLQLINPNTETCPLYRTRYDADLTRKLYNRVPVLVNEASKMNSWKVRFQRMFDMATDSTLFYETPSSSRVRLYEAKFVWHFDHRWATVESGETRRLSSTEKNNPSTCVIPRYWVESSEVDSRVAVSNRPWFLGFRLLTDSRNERTAVFGLIPYVAVGHSFAVFEKWQHSGMATTCFIANVNSLVFDYVARQKLGGTNFSYFILEQLPVIPPERYVDTDYEYIVPRVLELLYTAWDIKPYADDVWCSSSEALKTVLCRVLPSRESKSNSKPSLTPKELPFEPFGWDDDRRLRIRCELDAYFGHLFGLTRDEMAYILDPTAVFGEDFPGETFRLLKEREVGELGEYYTQKYVLEAFDRLAESPRFNNEMETRVSSLSGLAAAEEKR